MATLDDKLLGEKTHFYCSSSEDEDASGNQGPPSSIVPPKMPHPKMKQLQATNVRVFVSPLCFYLL
jgi:hypothetical protein